MTEIIQNLDSDLNKSKYKDLLIEIKQKEFGASWNAQLCKTMVVKSYKLKDEERDKTNFILINPSNYRDSDGPILLQAILKKLEGVITFELQKDLAKGLSAAAIKSLFTAFTGDVAKMIGGDLLGELGSSAASKIKDTFGLSFVADFVSEKISSLFEDSIEAVGDMMSEKLDSAVDLIEENEKRKLHLDAQAKKNLVELDDKFKNIGSIAQLTDICIGIMCAISYNSPKIIAISNPQRLDPLSIAIISKYFAISKNLDNGTRAGMSFVYIYEEELTEQSDNYTELIRQRGFLQRYSQLEIPGYDFPFVVVKSSTFVGRKDELAKLRLAFDATLQEKRATETFISGSPGIGKTTLCKKYLQNIVNDATIFKDDNGGEEPSLKNESIIRLSIFNDPNRVNSGLTSLISSIKSEMDRLSALYVENTSFTKKQCDEYKEAFTKKDLTKIPVIGEWLKITKNIEKSFDNLFKKDEHREQMLSQANKQKNSKEEQFETIYKALLGLLELSKKLTRDELLLSPIVLLVDDTQWIDESSSEFIITYLQQRKLPIQTIHTIRGEDAKDRINKLKADENNNKYTIELLKRAQVEQNVMPLKGFDAKLAKEVIDESIPSKDNSTKSQILANNIIKFVSGAGKEEHATTLFVIEAINILCDANFYARYDFRELIRVKDERAGFNEEIGETEFEESLKAILSKLEDTYKDSCSQSKGGFLLSTHAILEERLLLIEEFFSSSGANIGKSVIASLLLSGAIGSPFDKQLIEDIKESLAIDENPLLQPLKQKLQNIDKITNDYYETIEGVYELIVKEMRLLSSYIHSHQLLEIFLESKMQKAFDDTYAEEKGEAMEAFYELALNTLRKHKNSELFEKHEGSLSVAETKEKQIYMSLECKILKSLYTQNPDRWAESYTISLNNLATSYKNNNRIDEAIKLEEKSLGILESLYAQNPDRWAEHYTTSLSNLATSYKNNNRIDEAIKLEEKSLGILESLYAQNPDRWAEDYTISLNNLAYSYYQQGGRQKEKALGMFEEAYEIAKSHFGEEHRITQGWKDNYLYVKGEMEGEGVDVADNGSMEMMMELFAEFLELKKSEGEEIDMGDEKQLKALFAEFMEI